MLVALAVLFAVVMLPITIAYYFWIARHVAPYLLPLPLPLGMTIVALWVAAPWALFAVVIWYVGR
jgi:hypothetical protein